MRVWMAGLALLLSVLTPASAQSGGDPVAVVKKVYAAAEPARAGVYSRRLQRLFEQDAKRAKGEVGNLDFDFAVNAQDMEEGYKKTLRYEPVDVGPDRASVRVTFKNFAPQMLRYDLVRENGRWVVDEVRSLGKEKWVLSRVLKGE